MFPNDQAVFITAAGTPLDENGDLIEESFRKHLRHQVDNGVDGLLIAGSMGQMVGLKRSAYLGAIRAAVAEVGAEATILVGVGDNSIERTTERIDALRDLRIDAVVATTPYYAPSSQQDLIHYFSKLADASPFPFFLYDLPQATKVKVEMDTMLKLSEHPNIRGAKCSHDPAYVRMLFDAVADRDFDVVSAQYDLIDMFLRQGLLLQLDGFFCVMPGWLREIKNAYAQENFDEITRIQNRMTALRNAFLGMGVMPAWTVAMNLLGFDGRFHYSHMLPLAAEREPEVRKLLVEAELL